MKRDSAVSKDLSDSPLLGLPMPDISLSDAYHLRLKRRSLLWRALRARHRMTSVVDRTKTLQKSDILAVVVLRNEAARLPFFLSHYRRLGVSHFLVVDNASEDDTAQILADQPDVSVWRCSDPYRDSRFGLDWAGWLQMRYCHRHWTLTVDVDELLVYSGMADHPLPDLTAMLTAQGRDSFGALMLDMYPKGRLDAARYQPGDDPRKLLEWFDPGPYRAVRQSPMGNLWVQGGARERMFFAQDPQMGPTLNKIPLIRWHWRNAYVNSTHAALPRRLNAAYSGPGFDPPSGVLLHTKFLPEIVSKSEIEKQRKQHFGKPEALEPYYDQLISAPDLWYDQAVRYQDCAQLQALGLMSALRWPQ